MQAGCQVQTIMLMLPLSARNRDSASELVSTDIATNSIYMTQIRWPVERVVAALIIVNCLTKFPSLLMILSEMLATAGSDPHNCRPLRAQAAVAVRLAIFGLSTAVAVTAAHSLGEVISLRGGTCSTTVRSALLLLLLLVAKPGHQHHGSSRRCTTTSTPPRLVGARKGCNQGATTNTTTTGADARMYRRKT